MKILYTARLKEPIRLEDSWPTPFMQGEFRPISDENHIVAFELSFSDQPITYAPEWQKLDPGKHVGVITIRDALFPFVKTQLEGALAFIQCYFHVEVIIDEIEAQYIAESDDEKSQIPIDKWQHSGSKDIIPLTYDYFTRAIMAAESSSPPLFESTLVRAAYSAMREKRYIDSFRYSFLLMESTYGDGKFKKEQLQDAFKGNDELEKIISTILADPISLQNVDQSDTGLLILSKPDVGAIIDHLVEMRGFYFHGNRKRRDSWQPQQQKDAKDLCFLSLEIAMGISHHAATAMFDDNLSQKHLDTAKKVGATMTLKVSFRYRNPDEPVDRNDVMNFTIPGTQATTRMAAHVANQFLQKFEDGNPIGYLKSASCMVESTKQPLFDIIFHIPSG